MSKILGVHIPAELKNLAINGNMDFFQRLETGTNTFTASGSGYTADMFNTNTGGSATKSVTVTQSTNVPTLAQSGFESQTSVFVTNVSAITLSASDFVIPLQYNMEGYDYQRIHSKTITIGFWFNPSVAGTYPLSLRNQATTRSYVTTFNAVVGWQFIPITVTLDTTTSGYLFNNGLGLRMDICSNCGANNQTSTLNAWQTGNFISAPSVTNWTATAGATLLLTQFSIVEGPLGFGAKGFLRSGKDIEQELALCQRYYGKSYDVGTAPGTASVSTGVAGYWPVVTATAPSSSAVGAPVFFRTTMRAVPTVVNYSEAGVVNSCSLNRGTGFTCGQVFASTNSYLLLNNSGSTQTVGTGLTWHWTADAGL